jgi:hypothetical protein
MRVHIALCVCAEIKMTLVECDHSAHRHVSKVPFTMRK